MMSSMIEVPEHGWRGDVKKVQFGGSKAHAQQDETIIRLTFEYARLLGSDFTEAMRRALYLTLPVVIHQERKNREDLANYFGGGTQPVAQVVPPPSQIPLTSVHEEPAFPQEAEPSKPRPSRSGADLI